MAAKPWAALAWGLLAWTGEGLAQETNPPRATLGLPREVPIATLPAGPESLPQDPDRIVVIGGLGTPGLTVPLASPFPEVGPPQPIGPEPALLPVAAQRPAKSDNDNVLSTLIQLNPPGPQRLFRLESEEAWRERMRKEGQGRRQKVEFPEPIQAMPDVPLLPRPWQATMVRAEPSYVCYGRLWFAQRNFERYGWNLGVLAPGVATGVFLVDFATMPLNWLRDPCRTFECSSGLCLPGDATPLLLDPLRKQ